MQYPCNEFLSALLIGRAARFFTLAFLGRVYGQQMTSFFSRHYRPLLYLLISLAVSSASEPSSISNRTDRRSNAAWAKHAKVRVCRV